MTAAICDFCSDSPVRWRYPCESFVIVSADGDTLIIGDHGKLGTSGEPAPDGVNVLHTLVGDWASCQSCHELIQDNNIDAVTARCEKRYAEIYGEKFRLFYETGTDLAFSVMHHAFMAHRTGEPIPVKDGV